MIKITFDNDDPIFGKDAIAWLKLWHGDIKSISPIGINFEKRALLFSDEHYINNDRYYIDNLINIDWKKIRRRIEDALRKTTSNEQLGLIAHELNITIE